MDERKMILEMLQNNQITIAESLDLLAALDKTESTAPEIEVITVNGKTGNGKTKYPKRLRVEVSEKGKKVVNIKVPFSLVRVGFKMAKVVGPKYSEEAKVLEDIDIDELLQALKDDDIELPYVIVDVDEGVDGDMVKVILE